MEIEGMNLWDRFVLELGWLLKRAKEIWIVSVTGSDGHKHCEILCESFEAAQKRMNFLLSNSVPPPPRMEMFEGHIECYKPLWYRLFHSEVHGRWVSEYEYDVDKREDIRTGYSCDKCGSYYAERYNCCPNCKARMT